ncbi:NDUB6 dehydrogenase, partial [Glareola pratincola]|nr:NDUB6 dehydrogenase [Glareola pratincola]
MSGYSEDERLRLQQLRALRRRWLRDQELSEREPVLPRQKLGPVAAFWERFLRPGGLWRQQNSCFPCFGNPLYFICVTLLFLYPFPFFSLRPVQKNPHGVVMSNPRIFPGDRILETGEIIPPLKEEPGEHH